MSSDEIQRLVDAPGTLEGVRAMIRAARADAPSEAELAGLMDRLDAIDRAGPASTPWPRWWAMAGGAAILVVAVVGGWLASRGEAEDEPRRAPEASAQVDERAQVPGAPDVVPAPPAAVERREPEAQPVVSTPQPKPAAAPESAQRPSESALVERARAALAAGDAGRALATVAQHRRLYPSGVLVEEREAIAVEALLANGKVDAARERLAAFARRFPRSSYRRHLEGLAAP